MEQRIEFSLKNNLVVISSQLQYSLSILSMNNLDLLSHIQSISEENPFLIIKEEPLSNEFFTNELNIINNIPAIKNLRHDVFEQLIFLDLTTEEKKIAEILIDYAIENNILSTDEIRLLAKEYNKDYNYFLKLIDKLKTLSPSKIFALNLADKINFELGNQKDITPETFNNVIHNINLLLLNKKKEFKEACKFSDETFLNFLEKLKNLKLTEHIEKYSDPEFIIPDLTLNINNDIKLSSTMNLDLKFDTDLYNESVKHIKKIHDKNFIEKSSNQAKIVISAVAQRNQTLIKIVKEIINRQLDFFYYGGNLIPIKTQDIANSTFLHESTVNRTIANKNIQTPYGTFPLKFFMPRMIKNNDVSARSILAYLKELINNEPKDNPYSDENIVYFLNARGIDISRRTIAKYRAELKIPNSIKRREIK